MMLGNTPYVVSRAKARRQKLADRARLRQLINQSVDQLTVAVVTLATVLKSICTLVNWPVATSLKQR